MVASVTLALKKFVLVMGLSRASIEDSAFYFPKTLCANIEHKNQTWMHMGPQADVLTARRKSDCSESQHLLLRHDCLIALEDSELVPLSHITILLTCTYIG